MKELNEKESLFVKEYLIDLNATGAAIRAGYVGTTADSKAFAWVGESRDSCPENKRHVWDAVKSALKARCERIDIDADYVLKRLKDIDELDVLDILNDNGSLKPIKEWPKVWRTSISGVDLTEIGGDSVSLATIKRIRWPDKAKNLEMIGKHVRVQAFKDKVEHEGALVDDLSELMREISGDASG